jgi:protein transport protein SEC24
MNRRGIPQPYTDNISNFTDFTDSMPMAEISEHKNKFLNTNSSKNFIRATSSRIPSTDSLLSNSSIPFAIHFTPLNQLENDVPVFSFGNHDLPRCKLKECMGYVSPYVEWLDNGGSWKCNLCQNVNTSEEYFYDLKDKITMGTYELIANASYMDRPPMAPAYVIIIDVSLNTLQSGFFISIIETIKDVFKNNLFQNMERTKISIITYDTHVNFFKVNNDQFQMLCISDDELFLPTPVIYF